LLVNKSVSCQGARSSKRFSMHLKTLLLTVLAVLAPSALFGLGIRIADQDPFATARGNAFVATADNPSAVFYNPAGITQIEGQDIRFGVYGVHVRSRYHGAGGVTETKSGPQAIPQLYYTVRPKDWPVAFGLGVYSPFGLALEWPKSAPFRTLAKEGRILYATVNPVVAWEICPTLSIAAGPTFSYSEAFLSQGVVPGGAAGYQDIFKFRGDDTAVGFNAGILWRLHEQLSFGATYRSATTMDFSGGSHAFIPGMLNFKQSASASFDFPQSFAVGVSYRPTPKWNFEFDVDWTDWNTLNTVKLNQAIGSRALVFDWKSSLFYEWGVTRYFEKGFSVSGGYIYSQNSVPEKTFNPIVPDSDRHIFSVGCGQKHRRFTWDVAYQLAYGPSRSINNPVNADNAAANGRYEFMSHAITGSIGYQF
jgi:long-chain fatty acid transport protein